MKKISIPLFAVIFLSICTTFFSCGREEIEPTPTTPQPVDTSKVALKLQLNKSIVNVFELVNLELVAQGAGSTYLDYDSIVWVIGDIFRQKSSAPQYLITKKLSFSSPNECDAMVFGYKNGEITQSDTVNIRTQQRGDFLSVRWDNIDVPTFYPYGNEKEDYYLDLFYNRRLTKHALLSYSIMTFVDEADMIRRNLESRRLLSEYITSFYGASTFLYTGGDISQSDLVDEYEARFLTPLAGADLANPEFIFVPVEIWEAPTANIALIGTTFAGEDVPYTYFKVIAEPIQSTPAP